MIWKKNQRTADWTVDGCMTTVTDAGHGTDPGIEPEQNISVANGSKGVLANLSLHFPSSYINTPRLLAETRTSPHGTVYCINVNRRWSRLRS